VNLFVDRNQQCANFSSKCHRVVRIWIRLVDDICGLCYRRFRVSERVRVVSWWYLWCVTAGGRSPSGSSVLTFADVSTADAEISDEQHRALLTYFFSLLM